MKEATRRRKKERGNKSKMILKKKARANQQKNELQVSDSFLKGYEDYTY